MAARASYRELVHVTGPGFLVLAFLARLPAAMTPLGLITLVAAATGSFTSAGLSAAAYGAGAALGGPLVGMLADRYGQRPVGLAAALASAAALAAVTAGAHFAAHAATPAVALLAALAGFVTPQVGPLVRVRWAALLGDRGLARQMPTALSYEGAADELSYMAGPALVGALALLGGARVPLLASAVLTVAAAVPFALHHTAPPVVRVPGGRGSSAAAARPAPVRTVVLLMLSMLTVGVVFGATQTGVTAFADESGRSGAAGLVYAVLGVGSAVAGIATAWLPARIGPLARYAAGAVALAAGGLALALAPVTPAGMTVAMLLLGAASAPYLISVYALANVTTPAHRAGAVMTLLASGVVGGVALGAAVAGRLADSYGPAGAFLIPLAAGVLALLVTTVTLVTTRIDRTPDRPAPSRVPALTH